MGIFGTKMERYDELVALHEKCLSDRTPKPIKQLLATYCPKCNRKVSTKTVPIARDGTVVLTTALVDLTECKCGYRYAYGYLKFVD